MASVRLFFSGWVLCLFWPIQAQSDLHPTTPAPLYEHLAAVNEQWLAQAVPGEYSATVSFKSIDERIQCHLTLVERLLHDRPVAHLTERQRTQRADLLNALQQYHQAGRFPINTTKVKRTPIFVDERGVHCAVAQLVAHSGHPKLVDQISTYDNYATVAELLVYPELPRWADQHGMTIDELAWIQPPIYSSPVADFYPERFGNNYGIQGGQVREMQVYDDELYLAGTFSHIDSFPANLIAAWNGEQLRSFPGLAGVVEHLTIDETDGTIYVSGHFYTFPNEPGVVLLARYQAGAWEPLVNSHEVSTNVTHDGTGATINEIVWHDDKLYVAGNLTQFAGIEVNHLAVLDVATETWSNFLWNHFLTGALNDLDIQDDRIAITGRFALRSGADTVATNAALFDLSSSAHIPVPTSTNDYWAGRAIKIFYSPTTASYSFGVSWLVNSSGIIAPTILHPDTGLYFDFESSIYSGYYWGFGLIYGYFTNTEFPNYGIFTLLQSVPLRWPDVITDGPVTAIEPFGDYFIVAGDFSEFHGDSINDLVIARLGEPTATETPTEISAPTVSTDGTAIFLRNLPVNTQQAIFELFDLQGRSVWSQRLETDSHELRLQPRQLPAAAYLYRLIIDGTPTVGQVVLLK